MEKSPRKKRGPRKITARSLENAAVYYLQRFSSSTANFRHVMMRRVEKSARYHDSDVPEGATLVENLIKRFVANGYLNDASYAETLAGSLHRRGGSSRVIRGKLAQKGLDAEFIDRALAFLCEETPDPELTAALTFARKRRLGPYREGDKRTEFREKDLAAMSRAGFNYDMALKVVDTETVQKLEELMACP